jgi:hypothetical protein
MENSAEHDSRRSSGLVVCAFLDPIQYTNSFTVTNSERARMCPSVAASCFRVSRPETWRSNSYLADKAVPREAKSGYPLLAAGVFKGRTILVCLALFRTGLAVNVIHPWTDDAYLVHRLPDPGPRNFLSS